MPLAVALPPRQATYRVSMMSVLNKQGTPSPLLNFVLDRSRASSPGHALRFDGLHGAVAATEGGEDGEDGDDVFESAGRRNYPDFSRLNCGHANITNKEKQDIKHDTAAWRTTLDTLFNVVDTRNFLPPYLRGGYPKGLSN